MDMLQEDHEVPVQAQPDVGPDLFKRSLFLPVDILKVRETLRVSGTSPYLNFRHVESEDLLCGLLCTFKCTYP
jgi:hypothetical protein